MQFDFISPTGRIPVSEIAIHPIRPSQGKSWFALRRDLLPPPPGVTHVWGDETTDYPQIFVRRSIAVAAARIAGRTAHQWTTEPR